MTVGNGGSGNAGILNIDADLIKLDDLGQLSATTVFGEGGDISLQSQILQMRGESIIITSAGGKGNGGNIDINTNTLVALENSDITANAFTGSGGRVDINANAIFGLQPRSRDELTTLLSSNNPSELNPQELLTSDITAISQQNPDSSGTVEVIVPRTDPNNSLVELPTMTVETEVVKACATPGYAQSSFTITGKGSLPPSPFEPLSGRVNQTKLATLDEVEETKLQRSRINKKSEIKQIVEAQGWIKNRKGEIFLVANPPLNNNYQNQENSYNCKSLNG